MRRRRDPRTGAVDNRPLMLRRRLSLQLCAIAPGLVLLGTLSILFTSRHSIDLRAAGVVAGLAVALASVAVARYAIDVRRLRPLTTGDVIPAEVSTQNPPGCERSLMDPAS